MTKKERKRERGPSRGYRPYRGNGGEVNETGGGVWIAGVDQT